MIVSLSDFCLCAAVLAVSACGGSTNGEVNSYAFSNFDVGSDQSGELVDRINVLPTTISADLPEFGGATYDGMVGVLLPIDENDVLGTLRLYADFADNSLTGEAGNFFTPNNQPTEGSLVFTNGVISNDGTATGRVDITGQIEFPVGTMTLEDNLGFRFVGEEGEFVTGDLQFTNAVTESGDNMTAIILWSAELQ